MAELSKNFTPTLFEAFYMVDEEEDGLRLDQYCSRYLESFSRQQIKKKIKDGEVQIIDRPYPHKASVKVYHREKVRFFTPKGELEDEYWRGEKLELDESANVLHEDEGLIVCVKPPYMTTHPTGKHLFNCVTVYFENKLNHKVHSIHRIDRETSGIQLIGKNPKVAQKVSAFFENDQVTKAYFFISHKNKKIKFPFTANERMGAKEDYVPRLYVHCFPFDSLEGKSAQTHFELIFEDENYILGLAFPKTGRQHQIRAHAAFHGFPLLGDKLYNGDPKVFMRFKDEIATEDDHDLMQISRHALHAIAIKLDYPSQTKPSLFQSEVPNDLKIWLKDNFSKSIESINIKINEIIKEKL